jgi:ABC-2 type transport system permease protein
VSGAATLTWFARHEARLAWREWFSMMTGGRRARTRTVVLAIIAFAAFLHLFAYSIVARYANIPVNPGKQVLVIITGCGVLAFAMMVSQAMESVTRAFYARADLDLILSSPAAARKLFAVRLAAMGVSVAALTLTIAGPFINVLAYAGGARWLAAYGVVLAMGAVATSIAVALTVGLFRLLGPKRTRVVAQVAAAIVGAAFVIGVQLAAIASYGTISRTEILQSETLLAFAPAPDSIVWWPARAMFGDWAILAAMIAFATTLLVATVAVFSIRFGDHAIAASGIAASPRRRRQKAFRPGSAARALRRKEWLLLLRDPWLLSQSLMQILYLAPPALLLWKSYGEGSSAAVLVPVLVMAAGQLAGGLAWLAISGEDAPDFVATAPVAATALTRAKVEAVMIAITVAFAPFIAALLPTAPMSAAAAAIGIWSAAGSATAIQLWFRSHAKRSHFRRRQTASRIATLAEALSSITWAGAAGAAMVNLWLAGFIALIALAILAGTRALSPRHVS